MNERSRAAPREEVVGSARNVIASGAQILDVRQEGEFASGHLPRAVHIELGSLPIAGDVAPGPLTVMCGHGERAITAASLLERAGQRDLTVVLGGPSDWARVTGQPLERS
jgi:hydroxyacylglutathione hydrolase